MLIRAAFVRGWIRKVQPVIGNGPFRLAYTGEFRLSRYFYALDTRSNRHRVRLGCRV